MKKICVVTSTRAEYGVLKLLLKEIVNDSELQLCLVVTGMHLSPEFGMTINEIIDDGFDISERIDILMSSDSTSSISKSMGIAMISFSDMFNRQKPDFLIVVGDRYEMLSIAAAAMNERIPIAHISGGEITEGAVDDCVRHCLSKMSFLHFPGCEIYRQRIIQLGEYPNRVFNYGDIGVEMLKNISIMSKQHLEESINLKLDMPYMSVTFHPVTLEAETAENQVNELLLAIDKVNTMKFVITKANSDSGGRKINKILEEFVHTHDNCILFSSLGIEKYYSLLYYSDGIIGNSSSGIIEAPSFGIPTINIGNRQKGRLQADSVINCKPVHEEIINSIHKAQSLSFKNKAKNTKNPYESADTSKLIVSKIKEVLNQNKIQLKKKFFDIEFKY